MTKLRMTCLILAAAVGCKKKAADQPAPAPEANKPSPVEAAKPAEPTPAPAPAPAAAKPAPAADAKAPIAPATWLKNAPDKPITAKVGDLVWTIHGDAFGGDSGRVAVEELTAIDGNKATARPLAWIVSGGDAWHHKPNASEAPFGGLPGSIIVPAHTVDQVKPKAGDNLFVFTGNTPTPKFVHVKAVENGLVSYDLVNATGSGVDSLKTDLVEPYGKGLAPFTFVTYKDGDDQKLITVLAINGDTILGYDSAATLVTVKKSAVKSLTPQWKPRKVGDKVYAFAYGTGKSDAIKEIKVPDLAYSVGYSLVGWEYIFDKLP